MLRVGWFATARGTTSAKLLGAALKAIDGGLDARISFVFSNRDPGDFENTDRFFDTVRNAGIPLVTLSNTKFRRAAGGRLSRSGEALPDWRRDYDAAVARLIEPYPFDLGVLAGYMLIFTDVVCERWPLVNLHPALPGGPVGTWQEVIWQLIEAKAVESGVLWLLATTALDRGPTITYCRYSLRGGAIDDLWAQHGGRPLAELQAEGEANPLFHAIRVRGVAREVPLLAETLRAFATGRIRVLSLSKGRIEPGDDAPFRVVDSAGREIDGYDLTDAVEAAVAASGD